jgi:hypothetical protein
VQVHQRIKGQEFGLEISNTRLQGPLVLLAIEPERRNAIVAEAFAPGASVFAVARRVDVVPGLIYRWRQEFRAATRFQGPPPGSGAVRRA